MKRAILAVALLLCAMGAQAQNVVNFNVSNAISGVTATPTLTWSTVPAATQCVASGGWSGTKGSSGTEVQPSTTASKTYTLSCDFPGTPSIVTFQWVPATQNDNSSAYSDPKTTRIKYTFGPTAPTAVDACGGQIVCVDVDDTTTPRPSMKSVTGVTQTGTLRAIAMHINQQNLPSAASNAATKVFTAPVTVGQTVLVTFPGAPGSFQAN